MVAPRNAWRIEGLELIEWQNEKGLSYQIKKTFKRAGSTVEEVQKMTLFPDEVDNLKTLLTRIK